MFYVDTNKLDKPIISLMIIFIILMIFAQIIDYVENQRTNITENILKLPIQKKAQSVFINHVNEKECNEWVQDLKENENFQTISIVINNQLFENRSELNHLVCQYNNTIEYKTKNNTISP
jgi:hypothetical protein